MDLFRNRHFHALFFGRLFTNIGDSVYYIAMMWMVLKLGGNSTVYTGFAGFLFSLTEVLSLFYGPVLDKINAKKLLVTASVLQAGLLLFLVVLSKYGIMNVWLLLLSIPVLSFLSELTYPLESVLLPKAVEKKDLVKANSLMSIAYKGSDFFFNGIAGFILAAFSMSMVLGMNSLLFILSSILFLFLKVQVKRSKQTGSVREEWQAYKRDFKEGISFVKQPFILQLLIPLLFLNFFSQL
ncbi:MFS transporter [Heyndrickxia coagulans]|uniref:MFS transporter n=1 Tax=Heyndrickxia coagulans TaxID=1398 RepID=UPI002EB13108|nr:MFS transporter [Heyndrickxia coagulans]